MVENNLPDDATPLSDSDKAELEAEFDDATPLSDSEKAEFEEQIRLITDLVLARTKEMEEELRLREAGLVASETDLQRHRRLRATENWQIREELGKLPPPVARSRRPDPKKLSQGRKNRPKGR